MGRHSTGAISVNQAHKIELSYLLKKGHLKEGEENNFNLIWTNGWGQREGSVFASCKWKDFDRHLRLSYSLTDNNQVYKYDYKIRLDSVPSNLGKGEVLYFICPVSGDRCRVLYRAYGSHKWKAREAFQNRLYYPSQLSSKMNYANDRYWQLESQIKRLQAFKYFKYTYNEKPTKRALRLQYLMEKKGYYDRLRWGLNNLPLSLRKYF